MTTVPEGLTGLLVTAPLPTVALHAAAEQRDLHHALACRPQLPAAVIERCFVAGALPVIATAQTLVGRPLAARTVRHVLRTAAERRPAVLAALAEHNVPEVRDRPVLLGCEDAAVDNAILANPAWPVQEQISVARRVGGQAVVEWLSNLDPAVALTLHDVFDPAQPTRLDADPLTALRALLRRPWLSRLPLGQVGPGLRSAIATVAAEDRTLYQVLGRAQRAAAYGRSSDAATIIEAVACNPSAPLDVQRRCKRLARRLPCHYLEGWLPAPTDSTALWQTGPTGQRQAMTRIETLAHVRHRTVFSAGVLAANPQLVGDVRERIIVYLDAHLAAVDPEPATATLLADRLQVDDKTRSRWLRACQPRPLDRADSRPVASDSDERGELFSTRFPWDEVHLIDCDDDVHARLAARRLRAQLGTSADAWSIALLLLREGWDAPLAELPPVVGTLIPSVVA